MKAPDFWWDRSPGIIARLMLPIGAVYGALTALRMARKGARATVPVLCIGNFTAGGAGKTPTALALAEALRARGETPVFLTRGYGGTVTGVARVDPATHDARTVGDEALLLARLAPTIVAADRVAGAQAACEAGASVIVMDDGLQNPAIAKDCVIAVVDGGAGFGNGLCIPAGPLRAPLAGQAGFADAILSIGMGKGTTEAVSLAKSAGKPVFRANFSVSDTIADRIGGERVLAYAGIGRPQKFFETLIGLYAKIEGAQPFADHHAYTEADARGLLDTARARGLMLVTTEKDLVRLAGSPVLEELAAASLAVPIRLTLPDELIALVMAKLSAARR